MKKLLAGLLIACSMSSVATDANDAKKAETKETKDTEKTKKTKKSKEIEETVETETSSGGSGGSGSSIGTAKATDANLNGVYATSFAWSNTANPAKGDSTGFESNFASYGKADPTWTLLGTNDTKPGDSNSASIGGATLTWTYDSQASTWQIKSDSAVMIDLVLAVHAESESGAWLFNDLVLGENSSQAGSFAINWTNNGGQTPGFSNFSIFARDVGAAPAAVSPVPEPETYALMLAALGMITFVKRRKSS